jgi:hypothetical protein
VVAFAVDDPYLIQLWHNASRFRAAIKGCDRKRLTIGMQRFPSGSCGDATPLLGTYFIEQGLGSFTYALGLRSNGEPYGHQSHAWLEADGVIVDITADQFSEIDQKVIVTRHSDWHAAFERDDILKPHPADYRVYDSHTVSELGRAYSVILAELERP